MQSEIYLDMVSRSSLGGEAEVDGSPSSGFEAPLAKSVAGEASWLEIIPSALRSSMKAVVSWEHPIKDIHDLHVLPNGNILFKTSWTQNSGDAPRW